MSMKTIGVVPTIKLLLKFISRVILLLEALLILLSPFTYSVKAEPIESTNQQEAHAKWAKERKIAAAERPGEFPPVTTQFDLGELFHKDVFWGGPYLFSKMYVRSDFSTVYTLEQFQLIEQHRLLYCDPYYKDLALFVDMDFRSSITDAQKSTLAKMMKRQLAELYELDTKIIRTEKRFAWEWLKQNFMEDFGQGNWREQLLAERKVLLVHQTAERRAVVGVEK